MRTRTRSVAAVDLLGDAKVSQLGAKIDRDDAGTAILEGVARIGITIANFIQCVAGAVVIADPSLLTELVAERIGLIDLALRIETDGCGKRRRGESQHETSGERQSEGLTHRNT